MQETFQSLLRRGSIEDVELGLQWDSATLADEVIRRAAVLSQMGIGRGSKVAIAHSGSARFLRIYLPFGQSEQRQFASTAL
jgi:hypothetical protein